MAYWLIRKPGDRLNGWSIALDGNVFSKGARLWDREIIFLKALNVHPDGLVHTLFDVFDGLPCGYMHPGRSGA